MWAEFTAIYEPQPNGCFTASIAEIPGIHVSGKTLEEARATLTERLQRYLDYEHKEALARANASAHIERLRIKMPSRGPLDLKAKTPAVSAQAERRLAVEG